jgi:hypothetical protein
VAMRTELLGEIESKELNDDSQLCINALRTENIEDNSQIELQKSLHKDLVTQREATLQRRSKVS